MPRLIRGNQAAGTIKPVFGAHTYLDSVTDTNTSFENMKWSTITVDNYSAFDSTNCYYVVPVSGIYEVINNVNLRGFVAAWTGVYITHNTSQVAQGWQRDQSYCDYNATAVRAIIECDVGDLIKWQWHNGYTEPSTASAYNQASAQLIEFS